MRRIFFRDFNSEDDDDLKEKLKLKKKKNRTIIKTTK